MDAWRVTSYKNVYGLIVNERVCPYCNHKETYHGINKAISCYVCGNRLLKEAA